MAMYHEQRTVEWGNWGITFMEPQPDPTKNYGTIIGTVYFPCGTRGPCDGFIGSKEREGWKAMCRDWIERGVRPATLVEG